MHIFNIKRSPDTFPISERIPSSLRRMIKKLPILLGAIITFSSITVHAEPIDYQAEQENRKNLPIQTNEIPGWPAGPAIGAQSAILMDADTGAILYAKNIDERHFPASTTKIMTTLLAVENCELDEIVTFSHDAVYSIERGSSNIGMDEGEAITMNEALQGILILSANEVANAVGEHVAGSMEAFVEMMNQKAADLGCTNTHFMNTNGLHDDNHYTSARDFAIIAREFFNYDILCNISSTTYCTFEATATQPDSFSLATKNQLVKGKEHEYPNLVGSKTGFTSQARQTLVSCAKRDGMKLICVVFVEESPNQFTDTITLFEYGFNNFTKINIAENETAYTMQGSSFFESGTDIFGNSDPIFSLEKDKYVTVPKECQFSELTSSLSYGSNYESAVATISYQYGNQFVGETYVIVNAENATVFNQNSDTVSETPAGTNMGTDSSEPALTVNPAGLENTSDISSEATTPTTNLNKNNIFINIRPIVFVLVGIILVGIIVLIVRNILKNYHFAKRRKEIIKRRKSRRNMPSEFDKYDF